MEKKKIIGMSLATLCSFGLMAQAKAAEAIECNGSEYAKIGTTCYATLNDALSEVQSGETVTLEKDMLDTTSYVAAAQTGVNFTLDFQNHKIEFTGDATNSKFIIYGPVTLKNGTITSVTNNPEATAIAMDFNAKVILENMLVEGKYGSAIFQYGSNTTYAQGDYVTELTIDEKSKVTVSKDSGNATINGFNNNTGETPTKHKITVKGIVENNGANHSFSSINGSYKAGTTYDINIEPTAKVSSVNGSGILQMAEGNVVIKGEVTGGSSAVAVTKGKLTVEEGAKITATGDGSEYQPSADGVIYDNGSAIFLDPAAEVEVDIQGGDINSKKGYAISAPGDNNSDRLTIKVTDGNFDGGSGAIDVNDKEDFVEGGNFADNVDAKYIATNLVQGSNGEIGKETELFKITVEKTENGTIEVAENAFKGEKVVINVKPSEGYKLDTLTVQYETSDTTVKVNENNSFNMPGANVKVIATFVKIEEEVKEYTITTEATNGSITVDKEKAQAGDLIKLELTANEGYELATISITYVDNDNVTHEITLNEDGTFTMPEYNVSIKAEFKEKEPSIEDDDNNHEQEDNEPSQNPSTLDKITTYILSALGFSTALGYSVKKLNKKKNYKF